MSAGGRMGDFARGWQGALAGTRPLLFALMLPALACGGDPGAPTAVARRFVQAAQRGDMAGVFPLLEARAAQRLQVAAERATHHVGGRRTIAADEMLQIVDVDPLLRVAEVELVGEAAAASEGAVTSVRVHGSQGESFELALIFEGGGWRVQIPAPDPSPS